MNTLAFGDRAWISSSALSRGGRSSSKLLFTNDANRFSQGEPTCGRPASVAVQPRTRLMNRLLSFPPMPTEMTSVDADSASNCGGWLGYWATVKFSVLAPPQLTSVSDRLSAAAVRCG